LVTTQRRRPDISKARRLLGWAPVVPLEEGLRLTIDYFARERGVNAGA
jgi:nucleoside-diphosphate-sugar epimerase